MLNIKLGFYSAIIAAISVIIFSFAMVIDKNLSFFVCMILSWAYITLSCSFLTTFGEDKKAFGLSGLIFSVIYAVFINLVYFTQLTTVSYRAASEEVLKVLTFQLGSWLFMFDLFGYGMMALSTLFIGICINPKKLSEKILKALLITHGLFFPICIIFPILNLFKPETNASQGSNIWIIALEGWCLYFIPTMILVALYFRNRLKDLK